MRFFKYLSIALVAMTMVACSDDEPKNTFTREFNMIYPQLPAGHKMISKIERSQENGGSSVAVIDYDGNNHVEKINVTYRDKEGSEYNKEVFYFDYKNGAIICEKKIQPVTYSFEVNSLGAITRLSNVSSSRTAAAISYGYNNELEVAQIVSPTSTDVTVVNWDNGSLKNWKLNSAAKTDSVAYDYSSGIPNKGGIDICSNSPFTFPLLVCEVMRNAGFYGTTSAMLPNAVLKDCHKDPETGQMLLNNYAISYELDSDGYVKSYSTNESPKLMVRYTYR